MPRARGWFRALRFVDAFRIRNSGHTASDIAMHRQPLLQLLDAYLERYPDDRVRVDHVRQFVRVHADCFERTCREGHITGSAWIVSPDHRQVLLAHHRKLDRWLQLGGHADGQTDPAQVALREAQEESGLVHFEPWGGAWFPLDIDVHIIPARGDEPAHLHHDVRYLLVASPGQTLKVSDESLALRWFDADGVAAVSTEPSLLRMAHRAQQLLEARQR